MQLGQSTGVAAELETGWHLGTNSGVTNAVASCEWQDRKS